MNNAQQNNAVNSAGALVRTKTKTVIEHAKLDAGKILDIKVSIPKDLGKEAFVIAVIGSKGITEQYTVHRPIGVTDLNDDAWVMTRTSDLRYLLARSHDPSQKEIDRAIAKARNDFLVAQGLLTSKGDKIFYPPSVMGGKERNLVLDEADARLKEAKRIHKAEHDYAQRGKPKEAVYHGFPGNRDEFLEDEALAHEKKIREKLSSEDFKKIVAPIKAKQTFRTRGGPNEDKPQVHSIYFPKGDVDKAMDGISKLLARAAVNPMPKVSAQGDKSEVDASVASSTDTSSKPAEPAKGEKKGKA